MAVVCKISLVDGGRYQLDLTDSKKPWWGQVVFLDAETIAAIKEAVTPLTIERASSVPPIGQEWS